MVYSTVVFGVGCLPSVFRLVVSLAWTRKFKLEYFLLQLLPNYLMANLFFFLAIRAERGQEATFWFFFDLVETLAFVTAAVLFLIVAAYRPSKQLFRVASFVSGCGDYVVAAVFVVRPNYVLKNPVIAFVGAVFPWILAVRAMEKLRQELERSEPQEKQLVKDSGNFLEQASALVESVAASILSKLDVKKSLVVSKIANEDTHVMSQIVCEKQ